MRVGDVDFGQTVVEWPWVRDWSSTVHHDDERSLTAQEVDEELEEGIKGEGLEGEELVVVNNDKEGEGPTS